MNSLCLSVPVNGCLMGSLTTNGGIFDIIWLYTAHLNTFNAWVSQSSISVLDHLALDFQKPKFIWQCLFLEHAVPENGKTLGNDIYPLVIYTIYRWFTYWKWWFTMAMLNNQMVKWFSSCSLGFWLLGGLVYLTRVAFSWTQWRQPNLI